MSTLRQLFSIRADGPSWSQVLLLCAPVIISLLGLGLAGRLVESVLIALGAYIALFAPGQPRRRRAATYALAAVGMHLSILIGMAVGASLGAITVAYLAVAVISVAADIAFEFGPPGPYFFVLMVGGGALLQPAGLEPGNVLALIAAGNLLAALFGMVGPTMPSASEASLRPAWAQRWRAAVTWPSPQAVTLCRVALALPAASLATHWRGDRHPFWTVLVVVLVLSFPGDSHQLTVRAVQRLIGTTLGIAVFALLAYSPLAPPAYLLLMCVVFVLMGRYTVRNYTYGSVLITVFALLLTVPLSPGEPLAEIASSRWVDTLIAATIAAVALQLVNPKQPSVRAHKR